MAKFFDDSRVSELWAKVKSALGLKMDKAIYDPTGKAQDVFAYTDTALDGLPIKRIKGNAETRIDLDTIMTSGIYYFEERAVFTPTTDIGAAAALRSGAPLICSHRTQNIYVNTTEPYVREFGRGAWSNWEGRAPITAAGGAAKYLMLLDAPEYEDDAVPKKYVDGAISALPTKTLTGTADSPIDLDTLLEPGTYYLDGVLPQVTVLGETMDISYLSVATYAPGNMLLQNYSFCVSGLNYTVSRYYVVSAKTWDSWEMAVVPSADPATLKFAKDNMPDLSAADVGALPESGIVSQPGTPTSPDTILWVDTDEDTPALELDTIKAAAENAQTSATNAMTRANDAYMRANQAIEGGSTTAGIVETINDNIINNINPAISNLKLPYVGTVLSSSSTRVVGNFVNTQYQAYLSCVITLTGNVGADGLVCYFNLDSALLYPNFTLLSELVPCVIVSSPSNVSCRMLIASAYHNGNNWTVDISTAQSLASGTTICISAIIPYQKWSS